MDMGAVELNELMTRAEQAKTLYYRLALLREGDEWKAHTLIIETYPQTSGHESPTFVHQYDWACFVGGPIDSQTAQKWLTKRVGVLSDSQSDELEHKFTLYPFNGLVNYQHHSSCVSVDLQAVPWPLTRYDVTGTPQGYVSSTDRGFLLSNDEPFFPDFRTALLRLIYQVEDLAAHGNNSLSPAVVLRLAETEAWLAHIKMAPTAISITVAGDNVSGVRLTVTDTLVLNYEYQFESAETKEFPLPNGVPIALYVVLSRGNRWLDYYHRDDRWPITRGEQGNVNIEHPPVSPELEIETLIAQGEGQHIEFKSELNEDKKRLLNTVSAFANTDGGIIFFGVDNNGGVRGVSDDVSKVRDSVMRSIHDNIVPMPRIDQQIVEIGGVSIIVVRVEPTTTHACGVNRADPRYYVRRDATNFPAQPEEITNLIMLRHPRPPSHDPFLGYLH